MLMPGVEHRLLPEAQTHGKHTKTQLIYHSIVGSAEGAYGYFLRDTSLESTFIVKKNGHIIQLMYSWNRADANHTANRRAISVETEDNGNPNSDAWTEAQMKALIKIGLWVCKVHPVPKRRCPAHDQGGIGYHSMWGAPSEWTPTKGKTCPGKPIRIDQFDQRVLPGIIAGVDGGIDVPGDDDDSETPASEFTALWEHEMLLVKDANSNARYVVKPGGGFSKIPNSETLDPLVAVVYGKHENGSARHDLVPVLNERQVHVIAGTSTTTKWGQL